MTLRVVEPRASLVDQADALSQACESTGFFLVPVTAIDRSLADAAWRSAEEFFALPEPAKRTIAFPEPGYPYGYSPFKHESLAASLGDGAAPPDLKESLSVGPDCGTARIDPDLWVNSPSLWPEHPTDLQEVWTAYYRAMADLADHLMTVMAAALELPIGFFAPLIDRAISSMRAIHYPEVRGDPGASLRAGAHSDYGTFTILRTDLVPGLQIEDADGTWVDIEPNPDMFVVNLGDSIAQWTNDRWRSTLHRVTAQDSRARQSFAFFHMANWDAEISCLPTCLAPGESPRHEPVLAGPWLMQKFQSTV